MFLPRLTDPFPSRAHNSVARPDRTVKRRTVQGISLGLQLCRTVVLGVTLMPSFVRTTRCKLEFGERISEPAISFNSPSAILNPRHGTGQFDPTGLDLEDEGGHEVLRFLHRLNTRNRADIRTSIVRTLDTTLSCTDSERLHSIK